MIGENRQLATDEPGVFKTAGKIPIILEEFQTQFNKGKPEDVNM